MTATPVDVEFVSPLPGLGSHTSYTLERLAGAEGLYALRAAGGAVRLFLLDAQQDDDRYRPAVPASACAEIGAAAASDLRIFVVANPGDDGVHVNLRAPIVVHRGTGRAAQVILDDHSLPIRALLG